ncbi:hypothetical protein [Pseudovibrio sp. Tun.PSC04-5.I4]|uniref:hypothetical protein n=1 Tax=Pseudovibrio sp. Tun.PSC04-5.I4 TaxID=1798213 RepID=UPI000883BEDF|nr:hypothetical protein [Pseudovibrio sp. Tun.PSC04-5.I4]SDR06441.1 hypothetical protein SAMN04515695_2568 [Pseudovibrio sp. Tun.PSC04-5.I4]
MGDEVTQTNTQFAEIEQLNKRLNKLDKSIDVASGRLPVFVDEAGRSAFINAQLLADEQISIARKNYKVADLDGTTDVALMRAHVNSASNHFDKMQKIYQAGQGQAINDIEPLRPIAAKNKKDVEDVYANRDDLAKWNIDLSRFDGAYTQAQDNFTDMNTAFNGYVLSAVKVSLQKASINLSVFKDIYTWETAHLKAIEVSIVEKQSFTEQELANLHSKNTELEHDKATLATFEKCHDAALVETSRINTALKEKDGKEAETALLDLEKRFVEMQQIMLQAKAAPSTEDGESEADKSGSDAIKLLLHDVVELNQNVEELYAQKELVKEQGTDFSAFEAANQSVRANIIGAQSYLIDNNAKAANTKISEAQNNIGFMKEAVEEAKSSLAVVSEQMVLVRKQAEPLFARRSDFAQQVELGTFSTKNLKDFEQLCSKVDGIIVQGESFIKGQRIGEANQAVTNAQKGMRSLQDEVDFLQYMPTLKTVATKEESAEDFMETVDSLKQEIEEFKNHKSEFKDKEELTIFEYMYDKAVAYVDQAKVLFTREKYEVANDAVDSARITLNDLETAYERGVNTAAKVEGFLVDLQEAKDRIAAFDNFKSNITDADILGEFFSYSNIASDYAHEAETLLGLHKVKDTRGALADLKQALANLEQFITKPPRKKKRNGKRSAVSAEAENPAPENAEDLDLFAKQLAILRTDVEQLTNAVQTGKNTWEHFCEGEYAELFQAAHETAVENLSEANDWFDSADQIIGNPSVATMKESLFLGSMKAPISEAKQALIEMQNAFQVSKQILASQLKGINQGADYYASAFEDIYKVREEFSDWNLDLSAFDNAYLAAMENIANLKRAIDASDAPEARDALDKAEVDRATLLQAGAETRNVLQDVRTDLILHISDLQSEHSVLHKKISAVEANDGLLSTFEKASDAAFAGVEKALASIRDGNGNNAENQANEIEKHLASMSDAIQTAEAISAIEAASDEAKRYAETIYFTKEKDGIYAEVQKLHDVVPGAYEQWSEFCTGEYEWLFNELYESAQSNIFHASNLYDGTDEGDRTAVIKGMNAALSEAQNAYARMGDIYNVSKQLITSITKVLNARATYYQKMIEKTQGNAEKFVDWEVDLTSFETACDAAIERIAEMQTAAEKNDAVKGRELLVVVEDAVAAVDAAFEDADLVYEGERRSFAEGFGVYQADISSIYEARSSLEHEPNLLTAFDTAQRSALKTIDKALAQIKAGDRAGPDNEINEILNHMDLLRDLLKQVEPLANDPGVLGKTINEAQQKLSEYEALQGELKDKKEQGVYLGMLVKANEYAAEAQRLFEDGYFEYAEAELINLKVTLGTLDAAYKVGVETSKIALASQEEIDQISDQIAAFNSKRDTINDDDELSEFDGYYARATQAAFQAKLLLSKGQVRQAMTEMDKLREYLVEMEVLLELQKSASHRLKNKLKRKGKGDEVEKETAAEETAAEEDKLAGGDDDVRGHSDSFENTDEEREDKLTFDLRSLSKKLERALGNADDLIDKGEAGVYKNMCDKANEYGDDAELQLARKNYDGAQDALENLQITLDALKSAHEVGLQTSRRVPGYRKDIDQASDKILSLNSKRDTIKDAEEQSEFKKYYSLASHAGRQAKFYLDEGYVRKAKTEMEKLRENLEKMEKLIAVQGSKRHKLKNMLKRKGKGKAASKDSTGRGKK